ncbi:MAG: hypothetical protein K2O62_04820, partial [Clostridia bacterium]|nr:hypothetical protein [Clostridia bacterium]
VTVYSYDRSGYAHFGRTKTNGKVEGVGAYNDDGTPKSNAVIVYVNEANKNTVKATVNGKERTGIVSILQNAGTSTPLIVRIIGTVGAATWNKLDYNANNIYSAKNKMTADKVLAANGTTKLIDKYGIQLGDNYKADSLDQDISQATLISHNINTLNTSVYTELNGLSSKLKWDASKQEFDSCWNDCPISNVKNVTVEGIGEDARIFQWGMTFKNSDSIEVRNLTFEDYTEDACSFEGGSTSAANLDAFAHGNIWVHHNTFEEGVNYWDVCSEQDKHDGDGSTDFKGLKNITISYNVYNGTHKTGLIGGDNKHTTANVTFHHIYYNGCKSRLPLARQANMHMYNNYYNATTSTDISLRASAYALVENCYFSSTKSTNIELQHDATNGDGAAKVVGCTFASKTITTTDVNTNHLYVGNDRLATVTNTNKYGTAFDTNSSLFYYDSTNKKTDVTQMLTAAQTKELIPQLAGVQKRGGNVNAGGTGSGTGSGTGTETENPNPNPNPNPGGQTQTITVIDDFSAANGSLTYTLAPSSSTAKYFDSTQLSLYTTTDDTSKAFYCSNGYIKIQAANKIKFTTTSQVPAGAKIVVTMDSSNVATAIYVNDSKVDVIDGKVTFDLVSGTEYILGRVTGETRIASISIIIPA